jgi:hypothetical protein
MACRRSVPAWKTLAERIGDSVKMVAVSVESRAAAERWLADVGMVFDTVLVTPARELREKWGVPGVPTLLVAGADGQVLFSETGETSVGSLRAIDALASAW